MKFLRVLEGTSFKAPPVWIMRQAGRYLPEYRKLREQKPSFMEFCFTPELTIEATLQPFQRFGLDAAIIFSDILVIPEAFGQKVSFIKGDGPQLTPVDSEKALKALSTTCDFEVLTPVFEAVKGVRRALPKDIPLLGFAGGPWTVLTYMVEGRGSKGKGHLKTLKFFLQEPHLFQTLMDQVVEATIDYLGYQIEAGANAIKIFESWASSVPQSLREALLYDPLARIFKTLKSRFPETPLLLFPKGLPPEALAEIRLRTHPEGLAYDGSLSPATISQHACEAIQTGPDPSFLVAGGRPLKEEVRRYKEAFQGKPYIFNLSHGIVPETPIDHVHEMLHTLREEV